MDTGDDQNTKPVTQLPKPITVMGKAFQPVIEPEPEPEPEEVKPPEPPKDPDELPMPKVVYDDEEEEPALSSESATENEDKKEDPEALSESPAESPKDLAGEPDDEPLTNLMPLGDTATPTPETEENPTQAQSLPSVIPDGPDEKTIDESTALGEVNEPATGDLTSPVVQADNDFVIPALSREDLANPNASQTENVLQYSPQLGQPDVSSLPPQQDIPPQPSEINQFITPQPPAMPQIPTEQETLNVSPDATNPKPKGNGSKALLAIGAVLIGGGVVVGGYFAATSLLGNKDQTPAQQAYTEPTTTPIPTATPEIVTPSPSPSPATSPSPSASPASKTTGTTASDTEKADLVINLLNGSGEKGAASKAKLALTNAGFDTIKTGNADNFTYTETIIKVKKEHQSFVSAIKKALGSGYNFADETEELKASNANDIEIILGPTESDSDTSEASSSGQTG